MQVKNIDIDIYKNDIFDYLRDNIYSPIKFVNLTNLDVIDTMQPNDYIITPEKDGNRGWIVFTIINKIYFAVYVPKNDRDKNIYAIDIQAKQNIYKGTILECTHVIECKCHQYIVDEAHCALGIPVTDMIKYDRLQKIENIFATDIMQSNNNKMYVTKYYQINKEKIELLYMNIKSDPSISKIILHPNNSNKRAYIYTLSDSDRIDQTVVYGNIVLQKTKNTDVYNVYDPDKNGIALIPDTTTSKMCKEWFKKNKTGFVLTKSKFDIKRQKWIPVAIIESDYTLK